MAGRSRGAAASAVGAALGLFAGLLVETLLFVARNLKAEQVAKENAEAAAATKQRPSLAHSKLKEL